MTNEKEVKKLLKKFNKSPNAKLAYILSRILGYEPDLDAKYGTYLPPPSMNQIINRAQLPVSEFF